MTGLAGLGIGDEGAAVFLEALIEPVIHMAGLAIEAGLEHRAGMQRNPLAPLTGKYI